MKKRILILLGILIIGGAAGGVCWKMGFFSQEQESSESVYVTEISEIIGAVSGVSNRYAGVVEPQETVEVELEGGRKVREVQVKVGDEVKQGQLLFQYDLSSIQEDLDEASLEFDRLKNEAAGLKSQIATLEREKKKASKDEQLSYTIEIETNKMNLKKNEYSQKSKQAEITKLQNTMGNTEVRSSINGVIQKIDTSKLSSGDDSSDGFDDMEGDFSYTDDSSSGNGKNAFITILSTGAYRIKGTVNEMNVNSIMEGQPVIVRSRVDEEQIWRGTMGTVDRESANSQSSNSFSFGMMDASGDSQTSSTTYPFYVELQKSDGLMLGQHVYIEIDEGQEDKKPGLWLNEYYIVDADTNSPYVWAADKDKRLEKRSVILGQYDAELGEYEIVEGLDKKDKIAYPSELLTEGMKTTTSNEGMGMDPRGVDMEPMEGADEGMLEEEFPMDDEGMPEDGMVFDEPVEDGVMLDEADMSDEYMDDMGDEMMMEEFQEAPLGDDEFLAPAEGDMEEME